MEKTVNRPIAGTFGWLRAGGTKIELPDREERREIRLAAGESRTVVLEDGETPLYVEADLEEGSTLNLVHLPGGPESGDPCGSPACAGPVYSDIHVRCGKNAQFHWYRLVRGSKETYDNCSAVLEGRGSQFTADVGYRLCGNEKYDANCEAVHRGEKTQSRIFASGVLSDTAYKLFRGTIDFRKGCAGSSGTETEDVLLADETVRNLSVPVILCAEEDVAGNHGATIGRPDENLVYYLASRGLETEKALEMLAQAKLDAVINRIPDEEIRRSLQEG